MYDPLEDPTQRIPRHAIPPTHVKQFIDIPTQGYPDNYKQIGLLKNTDSEENKIIRLFGRQEFPGSNRYEYYTMISSGNDLIKIPIDNKKELYDDDIVTIDMLGTDYTVNLHDFDAPKYYPNI